MKLTLDVIVEDIIDYMKKSKEKFILIEDFPVVLTEIINKKYGKFSYTSEIGIAVKNKLKEDKNIVVYRPRYDIHDSNGAFTMSAGEYFAIKGAYKDVVDMKEKNKIIPMFFKRRQDVVAWERGEINVDEY